MTLSNNEIQKLNRMCPAAKLAGLGDVVATLQEGGGGGDEPIIDAVYVGAPILPAPPFAEVQMDFVVFAVRWNAGILEVNTYDLPVAGMQQRAFGTMISAVEGKLSIEDGDAVRVKPFQVNEILDVLVHADSGPVEPGILLSPGIDALSGFPGCCFTIDFGTDSTNNFVVGQALESATWPEGPVEKIKMATFGPGAAAGLWLSGHSVITAAP